MLQIFIEILVPVFLVVGVGFTVARTAETSPKNLTPRPTGFLEPVFVFDVLSNADLEADFVTSVVLIGTLVSAITLPVVITLL